MDNGNGFSTRKAKGKGASNTLQKFFNTLPNQITPESIARELFAEKIISEEDVERANNQLFTRDQRAEKLLLTLIRKVKGMPEWFDTICKILEKEIGTVVEDLRGMHLAALHLNITDTEYSNFVYLSQTLTYILYAAQFETEMKARIP